MRRFLTVMGVAALAIALLLNGSPASAGSASWTDPEGDATDFIDLAPPRPSEPAYDVLSVAMSSDDKNLTVTAKFKQLGTIPPQATGNTYRFYFVAGEGEFTASVIEDQIAGNFNTFAVYDPVTQINMAADCFKCRGTINVESNTVEFIMPIGSLEGARRAAGVAGKIAPGSKIEDVQVGAGEYYNGGYYIPGVNETLGGGVGFSLSNTADVAPLPAPGAYTL